MTQPRLPPLYPFIFLFYGYLEVLLFHVSVLLSGAAALWCRPFLYQEDILSSFHSLCLLITCMGIFVECLEALATLIFCRTHSILLVSEFKAQDLVWAINSFPLFSFKLYEQHF